jgi:chloramphenicol 3-O phosphotransferase
MGDPALRPGQIILLNGTSSSGKSTIAQALQEVMEAPYLHSGIDHFIERYPRRMIVHGDGAGPAADGWLATFHDSTFTAIRIGPAGYKFIAGMYQALAALGHAGINVIVDDVIYDEAVLKLAVDALPPAVVYFVGVRCPLEIAEQRERARGNRAPGGAKVFFEAVHRHGLYDLEVDSGELGPAECAMQIKRGLLNKPAPSAFSQLKVKLAMGAAERS